MNEWIPWRGRLSISNLELKLDCLVDLMRREDQFNLLYNNSPELEARAQAMPKEQKRIFALVVCIARFLLRYR